MCAFVRALRHFAFWHIVVLLWFRCGLAQVQGVQSYEVWVSNEKSGDVSVIDPSSHRSIATIPVGKRPRGIIASPDGETVYVALSGTPISGPPPLDANGNPILRKHQGDDDDDDEAKKADKSADGIGVVDVSARKFLRKLSVGSDPENFALSKDGTRLYVSNEDVATASVLNVSNGKVEHIIPVHREPEGVRTNPDGKFFYVTCENDGEIFAVDAQRFEVITHFNVGGRPRSADFLPDGSRAFIPSESAGQMHLIDAINHKETKTITLPKGSRPMCVKVGINGEKVYVSTGRAGTICVLNSGTGEALKTIKVGSRPWGIALSPDGKFLYAANGPSNDVSVVDLETEQEIARIKAGESPWGVAIVMRKF
jgi:YVTN family beta-propeller protein